MIRIPGKIMICGEYAVLRGGWALLCPVPRYLYVEERRPQEVPVHPRPAPKCDVDEPTPALPPEDGDGGGGASARASGHSNGRTSRSSSGSSSQTTDAMANGLSGDRFPVIDAALREPVPELAEFELEHGLPDPCIDRRELRALDGEDRDLKLGLGSSAAECVGVIALRYQRAGRRWQSRRREVMAYALAAHERAQGGRGSGADVAVCAMEEPITFRRAGEGIEVEPWRPAVPMTLVWTERSADTRGRVAKFESYLDSGGEAAGGLLADAIATGNRLAETLRSVPGAGGWKDCLDEYLERIGALMAAAGIDYLPPGYERMAAWARGQGLRVKPTGAGGGDMLLLLGEVPPQVMASCPLRSPVVIPLS